MKRVKFNLEKEDGTNLVKYPDDRALFKSVTVEGSIVYAEYLGSLELEEYVLIPDLTFTQYEFRQRFTFEELKGILLAAKTNQDVELFINLLDTAQEIRTIDVHLQQGLRDFEVLGILNEGRADEILGGE